MKHLLLLLFILFVSPAYSQGKYTIQGTIKNVPDHSVIRLYRTEGSSFIHLASDTLKKGLFKFNGKIETVTELALIGAGENFPPNGCRIWVAPNTTIKVNGNNRYVATWQVNSPVPEQKEANSYTVASRELQDSIQEIGILIKKQMNNLYTDLNARGIIKSLNKKKKQLQAQVSLKDMEIMKQSATITPLNMEKLLQAVNGIESGEFERRDLVEAQFARLTDNQKQSKYGDDINEVLYPLPPAQVGDEMADCYSLIDVEGNSHRLSDYKGHYILLHFWAHNCSSCIKAIPELQKVSELYQDKLTVISLYAAAPLAGEWKSGVKKGITWVSLADGKGRGKGISARYGVNAIPQFFLISPEGRIIGKRVGFGKGTVEKLVKEFLETE